ncbi:MAG TPA: Clp protease N-terminal domain-containing protein, partial [Candidatus Brocadiales bacterium]|nr:Clp protease N-terminal domain-containing protein [Candidatus Brocadiales bacterium]
MRFDRFTIKAQEAVQDAQQIAESKGHQQIDTLHLLAALLQQEHGIVTPVLQKLGVDKDSIYVKVMSSLDRLPQVRGA